MVAAPILPSTLEGYNIPRFSHDTHRAPVALLIAANFARIYRRQMKTTAAIAHSFLGIDYGIDQFTHRLMAHAEQMKCHALSGFGTNPRESLKFLN